MTRRNIDLNLGDLYHRRAVTKKLRTIRQDLGLTLADVGERLYVKRDAVSNFEIRANPNPHIVTVQRYARALSHRAQLTVHQLPQAGPDVALLERLVEAGDPVRADDAELSLALHRLIAARRHLGLPQTEVSRRMQLDETAVSQIEMRRHTPHLSLYQRYARALGGRLTVAFTPVPYVDEVLVDRAVAGRVPWAQLNDAERADAYLRLLRRGDGHATIARTLNCSGTTILDFAAKHFPQERAA